MHKSEDPIEFIRCKVAKEPKTRIFAPRNCNLCNRAFIPYTSENHYTRTFCHVCQSLISLYYDGSASIQNHRPVDVVKRTSTSVKKCIWDRVVGEYRRITGHAFPYHKRYILFQEPESRMEQLTKVYDKLHADYCAAMKKANTLRHTKTCSFCGDTFQCMTNTLEVVCPKCRWLFSIRDIHSMRQGLKTGIYTQETIKRMVQSRLDRLDELTQELIEQGLFNFSKRREHIDETDKERAEIIANLSKHKIVEEPIVRCVKCGVRIHNYVNNDDKICDTCRESMIPPEIRWFKGIVGLQNRSLESIAKLPRYCQALYTKHMSKEELEEFKRAEYPYKQREIRRMVLNERMKHLDDDDVTV